MTSNRASAAVKFDEVLSKEQQQLARRRDGVNWKDAGGYVGLAFSGGGIRSATFNLGILQGLVQRGLLPYVDYLSTVSGGGYLGAWLHGVIRRYCQGEPARADTWLSPEKHPKPGTPEEDPISFLRKYSSYLATDVGLFSADFWVILVIWFRNIFLNQLILVPLLAGIGLVAMLIGFLTAYRVTSTDLILPMIAAPLSLIVAAALAWWGVRGALDARDCQEDPKVEREPSGIGDSGAVFCAIFVLLASFVLAISSSAIVAAADKYSTLAILAIMALALAGVHCFLQGVGGFLGCYRAQHHDHEAGGWALLFALPILAAVVTAPLFYGVLYWISTWKEANAGSWYAVAWGPPLLMLVCLTSAGLHIGLMGIDFPDFGRESLARMGAYINIAGFAWALLFAMGIFGPYWISVLALNYGKTAVAAIGAWIAHTAAGVLSGRSEKTKGPDAAGSGSAALEWIGKLAPTVFLVGFLLLISFGVHTGLHGLFQNVKPAGCDAYHRQPVESAQGVAVSVSAPATGKTTVNLDYDKKAKTPPDWLSWLVPIKEEYWCVLDQEKNNTWTCVFAFLVAAGGMVLLIPWRFDINEFSLHHFYKNRLVRCYLGASRGSARAPSRLTGFDSCDDFPISSLLANPAERIARCEDEDATRIKPYYGPYPIVNGTVNLNRGSELSKQERQGESFVFTPLFCGYDPPTSPEDKRAVREHKVSEGGYHPTCNYGYAAGPALGACTAISGAAANPNHGYHTSAPLAFLLMIFDVRLGWWVGNPRLRKPSEKPGPQYALKPLISELFSQTDQRSKYLNISDGGHFENLGIYELVRRGCRYIIAGDGEQDNKLTFESLGGAVRKCRADFGVEIDIDPHRIHEQKDGFSLAHCVIGKIKYPEGETGWLLYLKASLTGDEPEDVIQYHAVHEDFPHQPTPNQFFTESQFESYRRLGLHVADTAFESIRIEDPIAMDRIFQCLYQQWYPPSEVSGEVSTRNANTFSALMKRLSDDKDLAYFDAQILRDANASPRGLPEDRKIEIERKAFFFCLDLIQLMENVWTDLHFYNKDDRDNPKNMGWVAIFKFWAHQDLFKETWDRASYSFNPLFHQFFNWCANSKLPEKPGPPPCGDLPA